MYIVIYIYANISGPPGNDLRITYKYFVDNRNLEFYQFKLVFVYVSSSIYLYASYIDIAIC